MKSTVLVLALALAGCAGPTYDYVHAEADAWGVFDPYLDKWIDSDASISPDKRDAMHEVNKGRKARVAHAISQVDSGK
jgi:hypothetical protein